MQLGKFKIDVVETGIFGLDGGAMFGVVPKVLWAKRYNPGDALNRIPLAARPMLVQWDDRKLLIDTGNGDKFNDKFADMYAIDREKSKLSTALAPLNIKPEEITDVVLTHLHFDHAGGATEYVNEELKPTFVNAKYWVQKEHWDWAFKPPVKEKASFLRENFELLKTDATVEFTDGSGEIYPGISVIPLFGHTHAMQAVKISDAGKSVLYCADLIPTSAHISVPFVMGFDNNPLAAIEEKQNLLPQAYEENWIMFYEHDAFRQATTVLSTPRGFLAGDDVIITP